MTVKTKMKTTGPLNDRSPKPGPAKRVRKPRLVLNPAAEAELKKDIIAALGTMKEKQADDMTAHVTVARRLSALKPLVKGEWEATVQELGIHPRVARRYLEL